MKCKLLKLCMATAILTGCNPVSENIPDKTWTSLHPLRPYQSEYYHGAAYRFPNGKCSEAQCHGNDLTGGNSGAPSCYSCHGDRWTIFSTTHTSNRGGFYHHTEVDDYPADRNVNTNWFNTCKNASCHGATLDGVADSGYSCKLCHTGFSGLIPPPGHSNREEGNWHHYNLERSHSTYCSGDACHGADGESGGSAATDFTGLTGHGQACSTCHD